MSSTGVGLYQWIPACAGMVGRLGFVFMNVLIWIQDSTLGTWVAGSIWGYPIVLACHALGMAVVVGTGGDDQSPGTWVCPQCACHIFL